MVRSSLVKNRILADIARSLHVDEIVRYNEMDRLNPHGVGQEGLLADAFEGL